MTRERWLNALAKKLVPFLKDLPCFPLDIKIRTELSPGIETTDDRLLVYISPSINTSIGVMEQILGKVVYVVGRTPPGDPDLLIFECVFELGAQLESILAELGPYPEK
jgi:hypothetical protein